MYEVITGDLQEIKSRVTKLEVLDEPTLEFLNANIEDWLKSDVRKTMLKAQDYYYADNEIKQRKRTYINRAGARQESKSLSNTKLPHSFLRKLVNQKVNYLLSKEFSIQSDNDLFLQALEPYLTKRLMKTIKNIGKKAITNGIAWLQVYYNDKGELSFKPIPSDEILPFWKDADHTELAGLIRTYQVTTFLADGTKKETTKVEYHTTEGVWYFEKGDKGLKIDEGHAESSGHFILQDEDGNDVEALWSRLPFIAFKYNEEEISLLMWVKALIDEYDYISSDASNVIKDIPDAIKVIKNYDGTNKEEFTENLNTFRLAFVEGDGGVETLETPFDISASEARLTRLRKDIYEFGSGVDTQETNLGNHASGVALKFRYSDLDIDVGDMAMEFSDAIEQLIWFMQVDMVNRGIGDFMGVTYDIIFNTEHIINESEVIVDAKNSIGIISEETIVANHPWVTDAQRELDRIKLERESVFNDLMSGDNWGTDEPNEDIEHLEDSDE